MSTNINTSRVHHDGAQAEAAIFGQFNSNKAIDLMVFKAVLGGQDNLTSIASHYRISSDLIKKSVTASLFIIEDDTISIA